MSSGAPSSVRSVSAADEPAEACSREVSEARGLSELLFSCSVFSVAEELSSAVCEVSKLPPSSEDELCVPESGLLPLSELSPKLLSALSSEDCGSP